MDLDKLQRKAWDRHGIAVVIGEVDEVMFFPGVDDVPGVLVAPSICDALSYLYEYVAVA